MLISDGDVAPERGLRRSTRAAECGSPMTARSWLVDDGMPIWKDPVNGDMPMLVTGWDDMDEMSLTLRCDETASLIGTSRSDGLASRIGAAGWIEDNEEVLMAVDDGIPVGADNEYGGDAEGYMDPSCKSLRPIFHSPYESRRASATSWLTFVSCDRARLRSRELPTQNCNL